jgi:hypothetical protein
VLTCPAGNGQTLCPRKAIWKTRGHFIGETITARPDSHLVDLLTDAGR